MRGVLIVLLVPSMALASSPLDDVIEEPPAECARGTSTTLWLSSKFPALPRHDGPEGESRFEVRAQGKAVGAVALPGGGRCHGFSPEAHAYVVSSVHERGMLLPIASLELLGEDGKVRTTAFERDEHEAFALVTSASRRWVAFIGDDARHEGSMKLFALDVVTDRIRLLGPAPAPPPAREGPRKRSWRWGVDGEEGYADIEPDVLRFDGEVLRASYGADTSRSRAKARRVRLFDLAR
jgi:hypothetical protein